MNIPLLDELRAIRRRLGEEADLDMERYAAMLRAHAEKSTGSYVTEPMLPPVSHPPQGVFKAAS